MPKSTRFLVVLCWMSLMAAAQPVISGDFLTYQGRLTDASNVPVPDGSYSVTFKIFSAPTGGLPLWSDVFSSVQTANGMFSVVLGSQSAMDLAALGKGNLYLEVKVGLLATMAPRTLLTSAPRAAIAGKVFGDVETSAGAMLIKRSDGDSSIAFASGDDRVAMKLFDPQPEPPGKAVVDVGVDPFDGASIRLFDPQPEPPGMAIEITSGMGGVTSALPSGTPSAISRPSIRMFDPQPEPPGKMFELVATSGSGPSMSFFNQAGQVMGVEPSPFNTGFSMKLFDPQPEPPGKMLEIGTSYGTGSGAGEAPVAGAGDTAWLRTYGPSSLGGQQEFVHMYSTDTDAELRLGPGAPFGSNSPRISAKSNGLESRMELIGQTVFSYAPQIVLSCANGNPRIGIGTLTPTQALHVAGNICYTGTIGACSDGKFKKAIEPVDNALDVVSGIQGVRYQWKTDEYPDQQFSEETQIGFVAQDVKKVLPEVVMEQPDGSLAIDYGRLTPVLLEAIKELKRQNEQLNRRIEALEQR